jgi:hypothetical protein
MNNLHGTWEDVAALNNAAGCEKIKQCWLYRDGQNTVFVVEKMTGVWVVEFDKGNGNKSIPITPADLEDAKVKALEIYNAEPWSRV